MAKSDLERYQRFSRRSLLLGGLHGAIFIGLGARLGYLQVTQKEHYKTLSDKNRIGVKYLPVNRGSITDRFGVPLAVNEQDFRVFLIAEQAEDVDILIQKIRDFIPLSIREEKKIKKEIKRKRSFTPVMIKDGLSWEQVAKIEANLPYLAGISIDEGRVRAYPMGEASAHIVGYVGSVNSAELTDEPIMSLPGFKIGKTGIEKKYDKILRGSVGISQVEINAVGREIRELSRKEGHDGKRIELSIDAELQIYCQTRLAQEKSACVVVMDAKTGEIYAMSSSPSFDPNLFTRGISAEQWEELLSNPGKPLTNKTVSGQYPPASTFKMVTALAAFESGIIKPSHNVVCNGYIEVGSDKFHCWKAAGHGKVDVISALAESCDIYFYDIARQVGIDKIAKMARKLGLGQKLGIEIPSEAAGLIPDKHWKMGRFGQKWHIGETIVASIGQGYIQTTPLQLATMTARMVNGGYAVKPTLIHSIDGKKSRQKKYKYLGLNKKYLKLVIKGMSDVVNSKKGTANSSQITDKGFQMGGKTGTSQVRRITKKQRAEGIKNSDLPWKYRHHALFTGFAPTKNPRYICTVIVEHGGSGSKAAAPIAKDIIIKTKERNPALRI